jgi:hypothetical protein
MPIIISAEGYDMVLVRHRPSSFPFLHTFAVADKKRWAVLLVSSRSMAFRMIVISLQSQNDTLNIADGMPM